MTKPEESRCFEQRFKESVLLPIIMFAIAIVIANCRAEQPRFWTPRYTQPFYGTLTQASTTHAFIHDSDDRTRKLPLATISKTDSLFVASSILENDSQIEIRSRLNAINQPLFTFEHHNGEKLIPESIDHLKFLSEFEVFLSSVSPRLLPESRINFLLIDKTYQEPARNHELNITPVNLGYNNDGNTLKALRDQLTRKQKIHLAELVLHSKCNQAGIYIPHWMIKGLIDLNFSKIGDKPFRKTAPSINRWLFDELDIESDNKRVDLSIPNLETLLFGNALQWRLAMNSTDEATKQSGVAVAPLLLSNFFISHPSHGKEKIERFMLVNSITRGLKRTTFAPHSVNETKEGTQSLKKFDTYSHLKNPYRPDENTIAIYALTGQRTLKELETEIAEAYREIGINLTFSQKSTATTRTVTYCCGR